MARLHKKLLKRGLAIFMALAMVFGGVMTVPAEANIAYAATATISSMSYYSTNDGPVLKASGVKDASYGFVMPVFNGGANTWEDVSADLSVKVLVNGTYTDIDNVSSFVYNSNWGHWSDGGFNGYWFKVSETTNLQLYSKATGVTLDYTLEFTKLSETTITSMAATQGPELTAGPTGSIGFTYPTFNGDSSITYEAVAADLAFYVKPVNSSEWVSIDNNAASGWIYDQNFGQFTDGPGGLWFNLTESINVKLESKSTGANIVYTLIYNQAERSSYALTAYESTTTYSADANGAIGFALPKIGGADVYESDLGNFVYEIKINGNWVPLSDYNVSTFNYSGSGYNTISDKNQWGYWVDYIYGLWFQPIQQDYELRIGYPEDGVAGGAINNNYVYYTLIGNPDAPRPVMPETDYELVSPDQIEIDGWDLIFNDEFSGNSLDMNSWSYVTGYYLSDDPNTWGWGNNELEHYTDSTENVYVQDGALHLKATDDPKVFEDIDPNRVAPYASGKIASQNKFSFKYGRIDFRAKLPTGNGLWPALWLLPETQDIYGTWAASGEIDVMEARGRVPGASSGAIHFGGAWPSNTYLGGDYAFPDGQTITSDYHVYSVIWEEEYIQWFVDGNLFFYATADQWYSNSAPNNNLAPFDQEFYIIMNLAVGGWFDGGITPNAGDIPAEMQVDYVRVYAAEGDSAATHSGTSGAGGSTGVGGGSTDSGNTDSGNTDSGNTDSGNTGDSNDTVVDSVGDGTVGLNRTNGTLEFYVKGASFADIHYKVNNGGQINVGMVNDGNGNFTYTVDGLNVGDTIEYSFTYNPGNGALDTAWASYTLTAESGNTDDGNTDDGNSDSGSNDDGNIDSGSSDSSDDTIVDSVGDGTVGFNRTNGTLEFYVKGVSFADIHYKVNNGGQINVGMVNDGSGNFTYTVDGLNVGDTIEYSFTYNPGNGALDTAWASYTLTAESGNTDNGNTDSGSTDSGSTDSGSTDSGSANTPVASGDGVTMYTDANYSGSAVTFGVGEYNMSDMIAAGIPNDQVSSIKVPLGYKLTVFKDINFAGNAAVYSKDAAYVGNDWNDQVTSFIIEEANYFIYNKNSGLVVDVAGGNSANGTNVQQYTLNGTQAQQWKVTKVEEGYYKITSALEGKALDVSDVSKDNGANVHIWEYVGGENQKWAINYVDDTYTTIVSKNSGLSLDADAWATTDGGNIIQWQLGNNQANQLWKFELVNADAAVPTGSGSGSTSGGSGDSGSTDSGSTGGTTGGNDYADKPVLRTDIAAREDQMFFQFNNETGGAFSDDEIYWSILGFHPQTGKLCYVDKDGNLIEATTALNTISKGDRMCADVYYTLAEKDYVYMPDIVSGRMYISYGSPVYVTINSDANGNVGFAGPDLNNTSDPNQDVYFEFVEFTITNGEYWGNTTRVDFFSFPVVSRLIGDGGFVSTPGDADTYDKTVGDIGTREEIFAAFAAEVPTEFKTLVQEPYRIMAPCKATFNEGGQYANYFDAYIDEIWNKFTYEDLVFTCQAGTFRGRVSGNDMIFSQDGGETGIVVSKPTTQDVLEGKGTLATGSSIEKVVQAQMCAAINRGVALTPDKWADSSAFYQGDVANFYSGFFHNHSVDGLAYGFCYDDVFDYSTLLHYTEPTALVIDLKW